MCIYIFQFILKEIKILSRLNTKIRYFSMFLHDRKQYGFHDCKFLVSIGKFEDGPWTMSFLPIPGDSDNFSWEKKKTLNQTKSPFQWTQLLLPQEAFSVLLLGARREELQIKEQGFLDRHVKTSQSMEGCRLSVETQVLKQMCRQNEWHYEKTWNTLHDLPVKSSVSQYFKSGKFAWWSLYLTRAE